MFSVVIPVRNDPLYREAVESVLRQTTRPHEVIVVDDGSSPPLEGGFQGGRVTLLRHESSKGPAAARNAGAAAATGDVLLFLDSDDLFGPDRISEIAGAHLNADVVVAWSAASSEVPERFTSSDLRRLFRGTTPHLGQTSVTRARFLPFNEQYFGCEDIEWWLRTVREGCSVTQLRSSQWKWRRGDHDRSLHGSEARVRGSRALLSEHAWLYDNDRRARSFRLVRMSAMQDAQALPAEASLTLLSAALAWPGRYVAAQARRHLRLRWAHLRERG